MTGPADPADIPDTMRVDVLGGSPTGDELAALFAVVSEAYREESADATADDDAGRNAWSLSQRALRTPLRRDVGWGRFGVE